MKKMTSKESLRLAADMVDQHHKIGNSHVKIARSDVSHKTAVSHLKCGTYELSNRDKHFISEGFVVRKTRRWKFLAVEPLPEYGEKPENKSHSMNRMQVSFPLAIKSMEAHIKFSDDKHRGGKTCSGSILEYVRILNPELYRNMCDNGLCIDFDEETQEIKLS